MNDDKVSVFIPAADNADVGILRVKYKVARQGIVPRDGGAVVVLGCRAPAVADDVLAAAGVVENPIDVSCTILGTTTAGETAARTAPITAASILETLSR